MSEQKPPVNKLDEFMIAPTGEAVLLMAVSAVGVALHRPLIFTSLGPTAYELIEKPHQKSSQPYNIVMGHFIGMLSGYAAVAMLHAWSVPAVNTAHTVPVMRLWCSGLAAALTVLGTLLLKAGQPAALSTTLLVALGSFQTFRDATSIMIAVLIITAIGEPIRRARLRSRTAAEAESS